MQHTRNKKNFLLLIFDGFGYRVEQQYNAINQANMVNYQYLLKNYPYSVLETSGRSVGLADNQMGNSEVGHMTMGMGRILYPEATRIQNSINSGEFFKDKNLLKIFNNINNNNNINIIVLLSTGGVHSNINHLLAFLKLAKIYDKNYKNIYIHAILDGRDMPPQSAENLLKLVLNTISNLDLKNCFIISIIGRYYAMDRDQRWERTEQAFKLFALADLDLLDSERVFTDPIAALNYGYKLGETDEFFKPTLILKNNNYKNNNYKILADDKIIFLNYRADRMRQLVHSFSDNNFNHFDRKNYKINNNIFILTQYAKNFLNHNNINIIFKQQDYNLGLGEVISKNNLTQLRIAETEKYAHVTYFFNGSIEIPFKNEERVLISSPKIKTYDLQPEMSAELITEKLIKSILSKKYDLIICNYANADMVGHTGNFQATVQALTYLDHCLGKIIKTLKSVNGELILTADHGNAELMFDEINQQPHTAHTTLPVPFIYLGRAVKSIKNGNLSDVAPTILALMGLTIPAEMTGKILINL